MKSLSKKSEANQVRIPITVRPRPEGSPLNFCANMKRTCTKIILHDEGSHNRESMKK